MTETNSNFSMDIYDWVYINFTLQTVLSQNLFMPNETIEKALDSIEYDGTSFDELSDRQKRDLIQENGFFSSCQTGNRIVAFALKRSGLNRDMLNSIQENIDNAYTSVIQEHGKSKLLEASYKHTLQTLSVFKP